MISRSVIAAAAVLALLLAAYGNHFRNGFHFDDDHAVVNNPFVRDIANVPRFFTDATTSSILASNQAYRPVLQTTLAIDYRIAGGYDPVVFQIDSFAWFVLLLACMWWLFARIVDRTAAFLATAIYALHPVCAETVNYVIQRGEIISTCGAVAALAMYAGVPRLRRTQAYLIPFAIGALAKPPALVFPALLFAYVWIVERRSAAASAMAALPSSIVALVLAAWIGRHTPPTFVAGAQSAAAYWLTQPFVWLRYAFAFVAPIDLSADNDWPLLHSIADARAIAGIVFVAALGCAIAWTARRDRTRPIAFGLLWFAIALLPTSVTPLAEVANDHRMLFPFVGLTLAVCSAALLWRRTVGIAAIAVVLLFEAVGVHARNEVWRTDEALWHDVTVKSPANGRGLMNYGLVRMAAGDYATATEYFERAVPLTPNYSLLHINLGIAYGAAGRLVDAEREFHAAIRLAPNDWRSHFYYGRWLRQIRRPDDALAELELAAKLNPLDEETARELRRARGR